MKRPFFTIGLTMLCTMFLLFQFGALYTLVFVAVLLLAAAVVAVCRKQKSKLLFLIGLAAICAVLCFSYTMNNKFTPALTYCGENIHIRGTLAEYPISKGEHSYIYSLKNCEIAGQQTDIDIDLFDQYLYNCRPGDTLQFTALQLQAKESEPKLKTFFHLADGAWLYAYTDSVTIEYSTHSRWQYAAKDLQHACLKILEDRLPQPESFVLSALIFGRRDRMDVQTEADFQLCGLAHLFAVSGLHVTFWTSLVFSFFGKRRRHKLPTVAAIGFIVFFMALTGFSVSVCRSGFMMIVLLIGNLFRYEADALNSLGLAVSILLFINPFSAASASLLLSASATAAIVLTAQPIQLYLTESLLRRLQSGFIINKLQAALGILFTSAVTLVGLLPLNAYFFGYFSLLAPISNLLCVPAAQFAMIFGTAATVCNPIPYFSDGLFAVSEQLLHYVLFVSRKIASVPFAIYITHMPSVLIWTALTAAVLLCVYILNKRNRKKIFTAALGCFCALFVGLNISSFANADRITLNIYNTGNDICISLYDAHGHCAVIGCSKNDYVLESVYKDLHYAGILQPDLLLLPRVFDDTQNDMQKATDLWQPQTVLSAVDFKTDHIAVTQASESTVTLCDNITVHYRCDETVSAIKITAAEKQILVCCTPASDFSVCDNRFSDGDILICRQAVPATLSTEPFQQIVLSCDKKEELYHFTDPILAEKTICTADEGKITLTIG